MSEKIYQLYLAKGYTEAYYQLSAEARKNLWQKAEERVTSSGGKLLIHCRSRWCDETYQGWGVIEYLDIKAVQRVAELDEKDEFFRYVESQTFLGVLGGGEQIPVLAAPNAIYELYMRKDLERDAWASLSQDMRDDISAGVRESIARLGGQGGWWRSVGWSNEEYDNYGIVAWPDAESVQAFYKDLSRIGWHRYFDARVILGTRTAA